MKKALNTFGRLVHQITSGRRIAPESKTPQRPVEVDPLVLRHVGGGDGASLPNKGW